MNIMPILINKKIIISKICSSFLVKVKFYSEVNRKKRIYNNKDLRPLGLMTIKDRIMTTILSFALTAKWEALLDSGVIGFRPGRSTHDAIQKIYSELIKGNRIILDADINKFFDNIRHNAILERLDIFHKTIKRFLKAGIIDNGRHLK